MNAIVHERKALVRGIVLAVTSSLLLAGCTTLPGVLNPYVRPGGNHPFQDKKEILPLNDAIGYADKVRGAYRCALTNQGLLSMGLGVVLIPLTGVVTYLGIIGASTKTIAATSISGASLLGAGVYLHSSPRQIIYAEASAAITCAISMVDPLQLSRVDADRLKTLVTGDPQSKPPGRDFPNMLSVVSSVIGDPEATKLAEQIKTGMNAGREVLVILTMAGSQLVSAVDGIVDKVDKQIAATIPDPRTLSSGLGGLIPIPKAGAVDFPTTKDIKDINLRKAQSVSPLDSALKYASLNIEMISDDLAFVSGIAERFKEVSIKTSLSTCGGAIENVTTAFRLIPETTTVTFTSANAGEHRSVVVGGKPPYFANPLRKPEAGNLKTDIISEPTGYQLRISIDKGATAGEYGRARCRSARMACS